MNVSLQHRAGSSDYIAAKGRQMNAPRSNSMMIAKPQTVKKQMPIDGSFIMLDDNARKLTDMGNFKSNGPGAQTSPQKDLTSRRDRFVKNF